MALINDIYVFVEKESLASDTEVSTHSVEEGYDITDTVKDKPESLSLSGKIVNYKNGGTEIKASEVISKLKSIKKKGTIVTYVGRNWKGNVQIKNINTDHGNDIWGGAVFSMELEERRFAKNAYVAPKINNSSVKNGGQKQVEKGENSSVYYTVKKGDCIAALVAEPNAPYKGISREGAESGYWGACNWVMKNNPQAFSRPGDFRTLKIGAKLYLGDR